MKKIVSGVWQRLARYFLAGVFAILPLVITIGIVIWVAGFIQNFIGPDTPLGGLLGRLGGSRSNTMISYAVGWLLVLGIVFALGVVIEMGAKRMLQNLVDGLLRRVPFVGTVYGAARQLIDMLDTKPETDLQGMSAVFCLFGQERGCGLLALLVTPQKFAINGRDYHVVIVPTAPVPVGGGLLFVPAESVVKADISVEGLMSIYVSMGVSIPQYISGAGDRNPR